ncbi:DUF5675 family protein [Desulfovibrio sp. Fe33]|uniref:DUF5675 family protein n=1 Tax=Desulfovibrio sp. Fe33 TaxID=3020842 RepID=UPI00234C9EDD|nr:DUF5675 family protein [Desulfovibrio sp. Fe33]
MRNVDIVRLEKGEEGTFGVLRLDGRVFGVTLEPQERGNRVGMSCIPAGIYTCNRVDSPAFGNTFEVADVPGRTHILFHPGNVVGDTRGCILLGSRFGEIGGERGILDSRAAFGEFLARCAGERAFRFEITE